jgi:outer membrane protein assembly factor BamD (BamD/ComL family)
LAFVGCQTKAEVEEGDLNPDQYFQRAIEAADVNNYRLAMAYYELFLERYPEDTERVIWASYEVAFLHHKMGDDKTALRLFDEFLEKYKNPPEGVAYPSAPLLLAEKVSSNIREEQEAAASRRRFFRRENTDS